MSRQTAIFVSNNGLSDAIGMAQILPYLEGLAVSGHKMICLSVEQEKNTEQYNELVAPRLRKANIVHRKIVRKDSEFLKYFERISRSRRISFHLNQLICEHRPTILHCRSYMPLAATLFAREYFNIPMIFDMRGFWIDERLESGVWHWPLGRAYARYFRRLEKLAIENVEALVTLTHSARRQLIQHECYAGQPVAVIPCCTDTQRFAPDLEVRDWTRAELGIDDGALVLVHSGSNGPLYRMDLVYKLFQKVSNTAKNARLLLIGPLDEHQHITKARAAGIKLNHEQLVCRYVTHDQVGRYLNAADVGLSFRIEGRSSSGVSATKLAEYQACGLPVVSTSSIGDIDTIIDNDLLGVVLDNYDEASLEYAAKRICERNFDNRVRIANRAREKFNLNRAVLTYDGLYRGIGGIEQEVA